MFQSNLRKNGSEIKFRFEMRCKMQGTRSQPTDLHFVSSSKQMKRIFLRKNEEIKILNYVFQLNGIS